MEFARHFERASPARDRPVRISTHHRDIGQTRECHPEIPIRRQPLEQANNLLARNDRVLVTAEQQEQARAQPQRRRLFPHRSGRTMACESLAARFERLRKISR